MVVMKLHDIDDTTRTLTKHLLTERVPNVCDALDTLLSGEGLKHGNTTYIWWEFFLDYGELTIQILTRDFGDDNQWLIDDISDNIHDIIFPCVSTCQDYMLKRAIPLGCPVLSSFTITGDEYDWEYSVSDLYIRKDTGLHFIPISIFDEPNNNNVSMTIL